MKRRGPLPPKARQLSERLHRDDETRMIRRYVERQDKYWADWHAKYLPGVTASVKALEDDRAAHDEQWKKRVGELRSASVRELLDDEVDRSPVL